MTRNHKIQRNIHRLVRNLLLLFFVPVLRIIGFSNRKRRSILFAGQAYYNSFYLSRALRLLGWRADLYNWDLNQSNQKYYHGEDYKIHYSKKVDIFYLFLFYLFAINKYDIFHFANKNGLSFGDPLRSFFKKITGEDGFEIRLIKALGKKIVYSNNGCMDGVSQTSFSRWGSESVCSICNWKNQSLVCNDKDNLIWGKFRNDMADYQCILGGNRVDYNDDPRVHETPEFYCLDPDIWHPDLSIPDEFKLNSYDSQKIYIFHSVGNHRERTGNTGVNIKSSHVYLPLIKRLQSEGLPLELINVTGLRNIDIRYYQAQADIVVDMLSFGWYGANVREAMMLGKPVICYMRPEWLKSVEMELPEFVRDMPIINATPLTVEDVLRQLIINKEQRIAIGNKSREFALKWHSADSGALKFDKIYTELLGI